MFAVSSQCPERVLHEGLASVQHESVQEQVWCCAPSAAHLCHVVLVQRQLAEPSVAWRSASLGL